uniref:Uncharacterized protein n=2 Tax=Nothobranchius kadleci TaxID=1051664 RepID=A0A1A8E782_NOTKA
MLSTTNNHREHGFCRNLPAKCLLSTSAVIKIPRVCLVWSNFICRTSRKTHGEHVPSHLDNEMLSTAEKSSELADIHVEIKRERERKERKSAHVDYESCCCNVGHCEPSPLLHAVC